MFKVLVTTFLLSLVWTPRVYATPATCQEVFKSAILDPMKFINESRLNKAGFSISKDADGKITLIDDKIKQPISTLKMVDVPYLYEWASKAEHDAWMQNKGVTAADMKYILASPGQSYGKGYYVSTNYWDSADYGSSLTAFKPRRPLLVLEYRRLTTDTLDTEKSLQLRLAGIDALGTSSSTWFSILNEKQLSTTSEPLSDIQFAPLENRPSPELMAVKFSVTRMWDQIPDGSPIKATYRSLFDLNSAASLFNNSAPIPKVRAFLDQLSKMFATAALFLDSSTPLDYFGELAKCLPKHKTSLTAKHASVTSLNELLELVKSRSHSDVKIRQERAIVLNHQGHEKVFRLDTTAWSFVSKSSDLKNTFITFQPLDEENPAAASQLEYLNLKIIAERSLYKVFPASLKEKYISALGKNSVLKFSTPIEETIMLQESVMAILEILMQPESDAGKSLLMVMNGGPPNPFYPPDPLAYYRAFLSLHPFEKNNELAANLYLEWVTGKLNGVSSSSRPLNPEALLMIAQNYVGPYLAANEFFNAWIALASDPAQAEIRRQMALEFLAKTYSGKIEALN